MNAPRAITGLDHPVIGVRDMDAARVAYERLGFTIPPRGSHVEWGTGNWCIMFERDYIELRGVVKDGPSHNLGEFLGKHGEGLMGVALGTDDAEASRTALLERGLDPQPVKGLRRNFELPEGWVQPRFSLCFLPPEEARGLMSVVLCQHLTPELLRRPEWLEHPNGACGVVRVTGCAKELKAVFAAQRRLFGEEAVRHDGERVAVTLEGRDALVFVTPGRLKELYPEAKEDPSGEPWLAAVTLRTRSAAATADYLSSWDVPVRRAADRALVTPAAQACGVVLEFSEVE